MNRFVERFTSSIVSVLACHDRVIFHGHLPFGGDKHLNRFVDYGLKIKRKDFLPFVEPLSESLVDCSCIFRQGLWRSEASSL